MAATCLSVKCTEVNVDIAPKNFACTIGRGINREGFNFKLAMVKNLFHLTPPEQIWSLKKIKVGLQTPPSPQTPNILCVPERTGTKESAAISKNVSAIFTILFLI